MPDALLAATPIAAVLIAMGALGLSAVASGALGLAAAAALAAVAFPLSAAPGGGAAAALGVAAEAAHATATILWIILPALTLYEYQSCSGGLARMRAALAGVTAEPVRQALLIAWFFGLFMEGAAGFGTPVALAAPLLVGLGFAPGRAVALALLGHAAGVTFGAVGAPPLAQIEIAGLDPLALAQATAAVAVLPGLVMLAAVVGLARGPGAARPAVGWALVAAACFFAPYGAIAALAGPELPTLAGALAGLGLFLGALRLAGGVGAARAEGLAGDLLPYALLVAAIVVTRLVAPVAATLGGVTVGWELPGGYAGRVAPLTHPGTAMAACVALAALASGRGGLLGGAALAALRRLAPVAAALLAMLLLARLMVRTGMVEALAVAAAGAGAGWPLVAPWVGALGSFVTGSATASSVLFTQLQASTADRLGLPPTLMAAAQGAGGAVGNVIAPHNIIAGCATVGLAGRESAVLRRTVGPACVALLAAGAATATLLALASP